MSALCRVGLHSWYSDGAMFTAADRCERCNRWRRREDGAEVERERGYWQAGMKPGEVVAALLVGPAVARSFGANVPSGGIPIPEEQPNDR